MKVFIASTLLGLSIFITSSSSAATSDKTEYDYPELNVTPRASDRIDSEAASEGRYRWGVFAPFQLSGLATAAAGAATFDVNYSMGSYVGVGVGGAWLILATVMEFTYSPYADASRLDASLPKKTVRDQLAHERAAEEAIRSASVTLERMKWVSFATNLAANAFIVIRPGAGVNGPQPANFGGAQIGAIAVGAVFSLAPLFFPAHYEEVASQQTEYKKRIYAPVASGTIFSDPTTHQPVPGLLLSLAL